MIATCSSRTARDALAAGTGMVTLDGKTALVAGAGSLGAPAALALAAEGVGRLLLLDPDPVAPADASGHLLLRAEDVGLARAAVVASRLARLFPGVEVRSVGEGAEALAVLAAQVDVAVDATNRFARMFEVNDAAAAARRPLVHGGALHLTAQLLTVVPGATGCLRCLFEVPPQETAVPAGGEPVLGPVASYAGALLAAEAVRLLDGEPGAYAGRLLVHDVRTAHTRAVPAARRPGCPACGDAGVQVAAGGRR